MSFLYFLSIKFYLCSIHGIMIIGEIVEDIIKQNMYKNNKNLSEIACKDSDAIRFESIDEGIRPPFFRDADRIIYSLSYTRYIDKTQVFSFNENDMISRRMTHVQMVSKIARTIGRALNLNEDLIEAAALGHDLGHAPIGHEGEKCLSILSQKYGEGFFNHNVQSVRLLMNVENNGDGKNITVQVLDAIFCHNGEMLENIYYPKKKSKEEFLKEYEISYKDQSILKKVRPMTLEGCVVRLSDIIAYIGKDVEDAVRLNLIRKEDIPSEVKEVLGTKNSTIVNTIIVDIINNSLGKNYIKMSDSIFKALKSLIDFNYKNIYLKANTDEDRQAMHNSFEKLFEIYLYQLEKNKKDEDIYKLFLDYMNDNYNSNTSNIRKIIDYMSGMTDDFFLNQYKKYIQGGGYEKD